MRLYEKNLKEHLAVFDRMHGLFNQVRDVGALAAKTLLSGGKTYSVEMSVRPLTASFWLLN
jgi:hypothetical protein